MPEYTQKELVEAAKNYKFRLQPETVNRCITCDHRKGEGSLSSCSLLNIAIAAPTKSNCPLYE